MEEGQLILRPLNSPRKGWEEAFREMHLAGDDRLLLPDNLDETFYDDWEQNDGDSQYNIILVELGRRDGAEMSKTHPCVVLSPPEMNRHLQTIVVAPMTTVPRTYPTRIPVLHNRQAGWIVLDQLTTIDRKRIRRVLGNLRNTEITRLKEVLRETYVE